jgi:hypothetical protein
MYDEVRTNHAPFATPEETLWMAERPVTLVAKALALAIVAIAIGLSISQLLVDEAAIIPVSVTASR